MSNLKNIYLSVKGLNPIYLGKFEETQQLVSTLNYFNDVLNVNVELLNEDFEFSEARKIRANPHEMFKSFKTMSLEEKQRLFKKAVRAPKSALDSAILNRDICTVGEPRAISYPIRVEEVEDVSLEIAGLHLAMLVPSIARSLPTKVVRSFETNTYFTQDQFDALTSKEKAKVNKAVSTYIKTLFRTNTKLEKNKVPSSLGLGTPSEFEGLNEVATFGSVGLNFLPAKHLLVDDPHETRQRSFKTIVKEYSEGINAILSPFSRSDRKSFIPQEFEKFKKGKSTIAKERSRPLSEAELQKLSTTLELINATLETSSLRDSAKTVCAFSSAQCRSTCLVSSGRRGTDAFDMLDLKRSLDEGHTRMLLGYYQTGFLANPYYFLRVLIEAIFNNYRSSMNALCEHNTNMFFEGRNSEEIKDTKTYFKKLPPSVRLNTYSDYPWELIYPNLFNVFAKSEKSRLRFKNYPKTHVQFYDYTKIPGRWATASRKTLSRKLGIPWSSEFTYPLPENYHLTYSFSGTSKSYEYQEICLEAGQFATVVFSSASLASSAIEDAFSMTSNTFRDMAGDDFYSLKIKPLVEKIRTALIDSFGKSNVKPLDKTSVQLASRFEPTRRIPQQFDGRRVISGDMYDLRFLDKHFQEGDEPLIVGLTWKIPKQIPITINNSIYALDPLFCAILLNKSEEPPTKEKDRLRYLDQRERVEMGVGFAVNMLSLGSSVTITEDDVTDCFTIYVTSVDPSQESTFALLDKISELDMQTLEIDSVSFNTETGASMNLTDGVQTFRFELDRLVSEPFRLVEDND